MQFDLPAEHGIWIPAKYLDRSIEQIILNRVDDYTPLAVFPEGIFDLKERIAGFSQLEESADSLSFTPCIGPYMTEEMFRDVANPAIPNMEYIIASTLSHYRSVNRSCSIFCLDGLREFVETGILTEFPQALQKGPLAPKYRAEIVQRMIDNLRQNHTIQILDYSKIAFPEDITLNFTTTTSHV